MASNSFGNVFKISTFGESHGEYMGLVIDGCPANLNITEKEINRDLRYRAPGSSQYVSARDEKDEVKIISGVFNGYTTGAPLTFLVENKDVDSSHYEKLKDLYRLGHADFTYYHKYKNFDYRGGGRASARETICRVIAGIIAKKLLTKNNIEICAHLHRVGNIGLNYPLFPEKNDVLEDDIFCPDKLMSDQMQTLIKEVKSDGDSIGGIVAFYCKGLPIGLGDPVYEKIEANLAKAMLSIPGAKGFDIGSGFDSASLKGSEHNDQMYVEQDQIHFKTNNAGGVLGGITSGEQIYGRVAFKPTSSIHKKQYTVNHKNQNQEYILSENARHDPCIAIRAVPVVEAMCSLVLVDYWLKNEPNISKQR